MTSTGPLSILSAPREAWQASRRWRQPWRCLETSSGSLWRETFLDRERGVFRTIEENIRHVCQRLGIQCDASQVMATAELRLDLYRRSLVPRPGSVETLSALRSAGFRIGLVSNASAQTDELWKETSMAPTGRCARLLLRGRDVQARPAHLPPSVRRS